MNKKFELFLSQIISSYLSLPLLLHEFAFVEPSHGAKVNKFPNSESCLNKQNTQVHTNVEACEADKGITHKVLCFWVRHELCQTEIVVATEHDCHLVEVLNSPV